MIYHNFANNENNVPVMVEWWQLTQLQHKLNQLDKVTNGSKFMHAYFQLMWMQLNDPTQKYKQWLTFYRIFTFASCGSDSHVRFCNLVVPNLIINYHLSSQNQDKMWPILLGIYH